MRKRSIKMPEPEMNQLPDEPARSILEPDAAPLKLEANLDLTSASELAKMLTALRGSALTIDASSVQHLGGQCGQVLVSALKTWRSDEVPFSIVDGSPEFVEGARLLGLRSALELEDARV